MVRVGCCLRAWAWYVSVGEAADAPGQCSCGAVGGVQGTLAECLGEDGGRVVACFLRLCEGGGKGIEGGVLDDLVHVIGYDLA